jgi:plasmid stability protein
MRTLEIANLPDELYDQIEKLARVRNRSVSELAADLLTQALTGDDAREAALLAEVRAERERMNVPFLTEEELQRMKRWGRP